MLTALADRSDEDFTMEVLEQGIEVRAQSLPPRHPQIAFAKLRLAEAMLKRSEFAAASALANAAFEILDGHEVAPPERAREAAALLASIENAAR